MSKTIVIIRGIPGSGKSTLATLFTKEGYEHFEADQFFMDKGIYKFDISKIKFAHDFCKLNCEKSMQKGHNVVISNTFTKKWEVAPYLTLAEKYNYNIQMIYCQSTFTNIHNVPTEKIKEMSERFEHFTI